MERAESVWGRGVSDDCLEYVKKDRRLHSLPLKRLSSSGSSSTLRGRVALRLDDIESMAAQRQAFRGQNVI